MITSTELSFLKSIENPRREGRDPITGLWQPHISFEGGNATLGYGHKLTDAEIAANVVLIGGVLVPITTFFTDAQIEELLLQDATEAGDTVTREFPNLSPNERLAVLDLVFNTGATEFKTPKALKGKGSKAFTALKKYSDSNRTDLKSRTVFIKEAFDSVKGFVQVKSIISSGLQTRRFIDRTIFDIDNTVKQKPTPPARPSIAPEPFSEF